ncbi:MAG: MAPEG family protein [Candidatus Berkiella sp.]
MVITGFYATLLSFYIFFLVLRVVGLRRKHRVGFLDGGHSDLIKAIRIHGNAIETIPVALIVMGCAELSHLRVLFMHCAGCLLIFARFYHAFGLSQSQGRSKGRTYGTLLTWFVIFSLGGYNLFVFARSLFL